MKMYCKFNFISELGKKYWKSQYGIKLDVNTTFVNLKTFFTQISVMFYYFQLVNNIKASVPRITNI